MDIQCHGRLQGIDPLSNPIARGETSQNNPHKAGTTTTTTTTTTVVGHLSLSLSLSLSLYIYIYIQAPFICVIMERRARTSIQLILSLNRPFGLNDLVRNGKK